MISFAKKKKKCGKSWERVNMSICQMVYSQSPSTTLLPATTDTKRHWKMLKAWNNGLTLI